MRGQAQVSASHLDEVRITPPCPDRQTMPDHPDQQTNRPKAQAQSKRPRLGALLTGEKPAGQQVGKSTRFDLYAPLPSTSA